MLFCIIIIIIGVEMKLTDGEDPLDDVQTLDLLPCVRAFAHVLFCDVLVAGNGQLGVFHERGHPLDDEVEDI